jgi:hypothetical protein
MHRSLGRNYANTGAMVVEAVNGQLLCNQYDRDSQGDNLLLADQEGSVTDIGHVPLGIAWKARYVPALGRLLVLSIIG